MNEAYIKDQRQSEEFINCGRAPHSLPQGGWARFSSEKIDHSSHEQGIIHDFKNKMSNDYQAADVEQDLYDAVRDLGAVDDEDCCLLEGGAGFSDQYGELFAQLQPQSEGFFLKPRLEKLLLKNKYFDLRLIQLTTNYREENSNQEKRAFRNRHDAESKHKNRHSDLLMQDSSNNKNEREDYEDGEDEDEEEDNNIDLDDFDDIPQNNSAELQGGCDDLDMNDLEALADQLEQDGPEAQQFFSGANSNRGGQLKQGFGLKFQPNNRNQSSEEQDSCDDYPPKRQQMQKNNKISDYNEDDDNIQASSIYLESIQALKEKEELQKQRKGWQRPFPWDNEVELANQHIFKNEVFRENQREIINATKSGKDVLALIPTGGGKSLTFQLSAVTDEGVTFVVMPLLSLIEDNYQFVTELGIPSCNLSSTSQSQKEQRRISDCYAAILESQYKLVYLTPEKLVKSPGLMTTMDELYKIGKLERFVIDEVHCVSHWGQDFRKDYLHLDMLKQRYPKVPLLCLTATATLKVKDDILMRLGIKSAICFQSSFNRTNLMYEIKDKKQFKNVNDDVVQMLRTRFRGKCGIIYCISRKECEKLSEILKRTYGIKCDYYHADLAYSKRKDIQERWMRNDIQIIIATIAFGMGINKKDVRFVIHYSMPKSLEGYVQECGRAGRDQQKSECILYYQYSDRKRNDFFIMNNHDNTMTRKNENVHALYAMLGYCEEPNVCRRKLQLQFLGEKFDASLCNNMCDNCRQNSGQQLRIQDHNYTREAKSIVQFVIDCCNYKQFINLKQAIEVLRGKKPKKQYLRADKMEFYMGKLKDVSERDCRRLVIQLLTLRVLKEQFSQNNIRGINVQSISVNLIPGRQDMLKKLMDDRLEVFMSKGIKDPSLEMTNSSAQMPNRVAALVPGQVLKGLAPTNNANQNRQQTQAREEVKQVVSEDTGRRNYVKQKTNQQASSISYADDNNYGFGPIGQSTVNDNGDARDRQAPSYIFSNNQNVSIFNNRPIQNDNQAQTVRSQTFPQHSNWKQSNTNNYGFRSVDEEANGDQSQGEQKKTSGYRKQQIDLPRASGPRKPLDVQMNDDYQQQPTQRASPVPIQNPNSNLDQLQLRPSVSKIPALKLDEFLRDELRSRLFMIRNRILNEVSEEENFSVSRAFSESGFQLFLSFAEQNLHDNSQEILAQLKIGKNRAQMEAIDKYGKLFLMEFNHFIFSNQLHLQIDKHSGVRSNAGADLDQDDLSTTREELMINQRRQENRLQNNYDNLTEKQRNDIANQKFAFEAHQEKDDFFSLKPKKNQKMPGMIVNPYDSKKPFNQDDEEDEATHYDLQKLRMMQSSIAVGGASQNNSANLKFKQTNQIHKVVKNAQMHNNHYGFGGDQDDDRDDEDNIQNKQVWRNQQQSEDRVGQGFSSGDSEEDVEDGSVLEVRQFNYSAKKGYGKSQNFSKKRKYNQMTGYSNKASSNVSNIQSNGANKRNKGKKGGAIPKSFK